MTWREFKELVEKEIAEQGETEEIHLHVIDVSFPGEIDVYCADGSLDIF